MKHIVFLFIVILLLFSAGCGTEEDVSDEAPVDETAIEDPVDEVEPEEEITENDEDLPNELSISISNYAYDPSTITVAVGTEVTWTNEDSVVHTVTSAGNFDSGNMAQGEVFSHTFNEPGTFDYICTPHPYMEGQVIVE